MDSPTSRVSTGSSGSGRGPTDAQNEVYGTLTRPKQPAARRPCGRVNIAEMVSRGIPEPEILAEWLERLGLSEYLALFISQGYDLVSISKITPEDLNALGIVRPDDRKRLIHDIQQWNLSDQCWPSFVAPESGIREWLSAIGLKQYVELFEREGNVTMRELERITWEDLEDIGVKKLGHMKRICLALKKLKHCRTHRMRPESQLLPSGVPQLNPYIGQAYNEDPYGTYRTRAAPPTAEAGKLRPVAPVPPSSRRPMSPNGRESTVFKNECFGVDTVEKKPTKLTLISTRQILSEFSELPRSMNGEPLYPERCAPSFSHGMPPPPAPQPTGAYACNTYGSLDSVSSMQPTTHEAIESGYLRSDRSNPAFLSQPTTPRHIGSFAFAPTTLHQSSQHEITSTMIRRN
ncbi:Protein C46H3.2 b [Aphelenchoides avenae]|nr:Protein C46H3.2 b [Aphelenchus avenae]